MRPNDAPFARAVVTHSALYASITAARTIRTYNAA